jgi:hypothetical protein
MVRLLVEQVTVDVQGASEQVEVTVQWAGGWTSAHCIRRPVARYAQLSTYTALVQRIDVLRQAGQSAAQIAERLNHEGFSPPKRAARFSVPMITRFLRQHRGHGPGRQTPMQARGLQPDECWLTDVARQLNIPVATLHKWKRVEWVHSRKVEGAGGRVALWADDEERDRLRRLHTYKRRWPERYYPKDLTTPKARSH